MKAHIDEKSRELKRMSLNEMLKENLSPQSYSEHFVKDYQNSYLNMFSQQCLVDKQRWIDKYPELNHQSNTQQIEAKKLNAIVNTSQTCNEQSSNEQESLQQKQDQKNLDQSLKSSFMNLARNTIYQKNDLLMFESIVEESQGDHSQYDNQANEQNQNEDEEEINDFKVQFGNKVLTQLKTNRLRGNVLTLSKAQNNFRNKLMMITNIRNKMIFFFRNYTLSGRNFYLQSQRIRQMINDKCDYTHLRRKFFCFNFIIDHLESGFQKADKKVRKIFNLIDPHSGTGTFFLVVFALINILFYLIFSIMIVFSGPSWYEKLIYRITNGIWVIEALVILNTQVFDLSKLISDRNTIFALYIKNRALFDILPFFFILIIPELQSKGVRSVCQLLSFIKLKNLFIDINEIQKRLCMSVKNYYIVELVNLIAKLFIIGHAIACIWYLIGRFELLYLGQEETWYDEGLAADHVWWKLYLQSFYWSLTLMTTGSNTANSLFQMFFTSSLMLFTTIGFGYMLNIIGLILSQLDRQDESKRRDLNVINEYMRQNKISKNLQARVNLDLEFYYKKNLTKEKEEKQQVLNKISPHLQSQIQIEYSQQLFEKIGSLSTQFSSEVILELSHNLEELYFLPHQLIFSEQDHRDIGLMYIVQGTVDLQCSCLGDEKTLKTIQKLQKGDVLGQASFFTGLSYQVNARASSYTKLIKINREKFLSIIQNREKDYEVFCQLKDKLMLYQNYSIIQERCTFCQVDSHLYSDCHLVQLKKDFIYKKIKFFEKDVQERKKYNRRLAYYNTFKIRKIAEANAKTYKNSLKFHSDTKRNLIEQEQFMNYNSASSDESNSSYESNQMQTQISEESIAESDKSPTTAHKIKNIFNFTQDLENNKSDLNILRNETKLIKCFSPSRIPKIPIIEQSQKNSLLASIEEQVSYFNTNEQNSPEQQNQNQGYSTVTLQTNDRKKLQNKWLNRIKEKSKVVGYHEKKEDKLLSPFYGFNSKFLIEHAKEQLSNPKTPFDKPQSRRNSAAKHQLTLEFLQNKLRSLLIEKDKSDQLILDPWEFEKVKDYKYYFPQGNSKVVLFKYLKHQKKKYKIINMLKRGSNK